MVCNCMHACMCICSNGKITTNCHMQKTTVTITMFKHYCYYQISGFCCCGSNKAQKSIPIVICLEKRRREKSIWKEEDNQKLDKNRIFFLNFGALPSRSSSWDSVDRISTLTRINKITSTQDDDLDDGFVYWDQCFSLSAYLFHHHHDFYGNHRINDTHSQPHNLLILFCGFFPLVVRTVYLLILKWHVSSKLKQVLPMQLRFDKRLVDKKHNGSFHRIALTLFNLSTYVFLGTLPILVNYLN